MDRAIHGVAADEFSQCIGRGAAAVDGGIAGAAARLALGRGNTLKLNNFAAQAQGIAIQYRQLAWLGGDMQFATRQSRGVRGAEEQRNSDQDRNNAQRGG